MRDEPPVKNVVHALLNRQLTPLLDDGDQVIERLVKRPRDGGAHLIEGDLRPQFGGEPRLQRNFSGQVGLHVGVVEIGHCLGRLNTGDG